MIESWATNSAPLDGQKLLQHTDIGVSVDRIDRRKLHTIEMVIALYINRATMRCIRLLTDSLSSSRSSTKGTTAGQEDTHAQRLGCEVDSVTRAE